MSPPDVVDAGLIHRLDGSRQSVGSLDEVEEVKT
jgi:hypothetical protein